MCQMQSWTQEAPGASDPHAGPQLEGQTSTGLLRPSCPHPHPHQLWNSLGVGDLAQVKCFLRASVSLIGNWEKLPGSLSRSRGVEGE